MESVPSVIVIGGGGGHNKRTERAPDALAQLQCAFSMNGILWLEGAVRRDPAIDVWPVEFVATPCGADAIGWNARWSCN